MNPLNIKVTTKSQKSHSSTCANTRRNGHIEQNRISNITEVPNHETLTEILYRNYSAAGRGVEALVVW